MKINAMSRSLGAQAPVWSPADEEGGGATDGEATSTDKTVDEGTAQTDGTVRGGGADDTSGTDDKDGTADKDKDDPAKEGSDDKDGKDGEDDDKPDAGDEVPEDGVYEFELPDGVEVSDDDKTKWSTQFKELGLTRTQAAKLVETQAAQVAQEAKDYSDFIANQQSEHLEAAKSDKDIGGDNWAETQRLANLGMKTLGGDTLKNLILTSGNGNNPDVLRELRTIGLMVSDDNFETGSHHEAPVPTEKSWYGDTTPETKKG